MSKAWISLFEREVEFPLEQIRAILDDPHLDEVQALKQRREMLVLQG